MANFDYANVFYKNKIFSLSDVNLFRNKVEEAEKIDNFFLYVIPNMNHIRDYIIYSYIFEKNLAIEDRINYIKGLVYASDYVDFNDLDCLSEDIRFLNNFDYEPDVHEKQNYYNYNFKKYSIWKFTSYFKSANQNDFLDQLEESQTIEVKINNNENNILNNDVFARQLDNANVCSVKLIENENSTTNPTKDDDYDDGFISVEKKLELFETNAEKYIQKTMLLKINENKITNEDMPKVIAGMDRWFEFIFSSMKDIIELENYKLEYKNENIFKYL